MNGDVEIFYRQNEALESSQKEDGLKVFSYEIDESGRRKFVVSKISEFWTYYQNRNSKHFYEVISDFSKSKLYFDLEFPKAENGNKDGEIMTKNLIRRVNEYLKEEYNIDSTDQDVMVLDSSNSTKYSCHLIFQKVCFNENKKIKTFFLDFEAKLSESDKSEFQIINKGKETSFVDKTVYSRNRNFRLIGSTKYGKTTPLTPASFDVSTVGSSEYKIFENSLITNIERDCRVLDDVRGPTENNEIIRAMNNRTTEGNTFSNLPSPYADLDDFVKSKLHPGGFLRQGIVHYFLKPCMQPATTLFMMPQKFNF